MQLDSKASSEKPGLIQKLTLLPAGGGKHDLLWSLLSMNYPLVLCFMYLFVLCMRNSCFEDFLNSTAWFTLHLRWCSSSDWTCATYLIFEWYMLIASTVSWCWTHFSCTSSRTYKGLAAATLFSEQRERFREGDEVPAESMAFLQESISIPDRICMAPMNSFPSELTCCLWNHEESRSLLGCNSVQEIKTCWGPFWRMKPDTSLWKPPSRWKEK